MPTVCIGARHTASSSIPLHLDPGLALPRAELLTRHLARVGNTRTAMGIIARLLFDCAASAFEVRRSPPGPILVVDDDPDLLEMVGLVLESAGYAVLPAMNGIEALRRVQEGHPALILLDMKMPLMDGWEFMARYRQLHNHQSPVIILTAAQDARAWAEQVQADGYLAKPFDIADLLNIVDKHIRGARTGGGN